MKATQLTIISFILFLLGTASAFAVQTLFFDPLIQNIRIVENGPSSPIVLLIENNTQILLERGGSSPEEHVHKLNIYKNTLNDAKSKHLKVAVCSDCLDKPIKMLLTSLPSQVPLSREDDLDQKLMKVQAQLAQLRDALKSKSDASDPTSSRLEKEIREAFLPAEAHAAEPAPKSLLDDLVPPEANEAKAAD